MMIYKESWDMGKESGKTPSNHHRHHHHRITVAFLKNHTLIHPPIAKDLYRTVLKTQYQEKLHPESCAKRLFFLSPFSLFILTLYRFTIQVILTTVIVINTPLYVVKSSIMTSSSG